MICNAKYRYKIELVTAADILEFTRIALQCPYAVSLVSGNKRLNGKSYLGVALAKMSWDELYVETECDCYFEFEKFIR